ncbi:MAG: family 16 glycosylhydrolase [Firmicutes bacterium]|nr:family 16 glycosylhydrolase [Bacillota bacterium]
MKKIGSCLLSFLLTAALLLTSASPVFVFAGEPPAYSGNFVSSAGLDSSGFVPDEVWDQIGWTAMTHSSNSDAVSGQFKFVRSGNNYYFLIDVSTSNSDNILAYSTEETTASNFWNQDCVEIFLNEDPDTVYGSVEIGQGAEAYRHIRVNANGVISEGNFGSGILAVTENAAKVTKTANGFLYQVRLTSRLCNSAQAAETDRRIGVEVFAYNTANGGAWDYWAIDRAAEAAANNWGNAAPSVTTSKFGIVTVNANRITVSDKGIKTLSGSDADPNGVDLQTARVDSSVWDAIAWETMPYSSDTAKISSRFKMVRIENVYYFLVDVTTSNRSAVKAYSAEETTASNFWNQDCVEIFLNEDLDTVFGPAQIAQNPDAYRHIRINAAGVIGEGNFGSGDPKVTENYAVVTPTPSGFLYEIAVRAATKSAAELSAADNRIGLEVFAYNTEGAWNYWAIDRAAAAAEKNWSNAAPSVTTKYLGLVTTNSNHIAVDEAVNAGQTAPNPSRLTLDSDTLILKEGSSQKLSVRIEPFLANPALTYGSADQTVATISSDGVIQALQGGSTRLTVTGSGGVSAGCELTVEPLFVVPGTPDYIGKTETTDYTPPKSIQIGENTYSLKFFDGFDGTALDPSKWEFMPEWQTKEGFYQDDAVSVENGKLVLTQYVSKDVDAKKAEQLASRNLPTDYYLGGAGLQTKGRFSQTYGYYEISMKIPFTQGYWAAFWLLNDSVDYVSNRDENGLLGCELDIFEAFPNLYPKVHSTCHFSGQSVAAVSNAPEFYDSYHTIACEWNRDDYVIYIDGKRTVSLKSAAEAEARIMEICRNPLYLCITTEFGGGSKVDMEKVQWLNDTYGVIDRVYVDYVRAYSLDGALNANNRVDVEGTGYRMLADISSGIYYGQINHPVSPTEKEAEAKPIVWNVQGLEGLNDAAPADHLVLSSPYVLDFHIFDQNTNVWQNSALRSYLNSTADGDFLAPSHFTSAEADGIGETDVRIYQNDGQLLDAGTAKMYLKGHNGVVNTSDNASMNGIVGNAVLWSSLGDRSALISGSSYTAWADLWFTPGASYRGSSGNVNHYLMNPAGRSNGVRFVAYGNAHPDLDNGANIRSATMAISPLFKLDPEQIVFASKIVPETYGNPMTTQAIADRYEAYCYKLTLKDAALNLSLKDNDKTDFTVQPGEQLKLNVATTVSNLSNKTIVYKIVDRDNWLCGYGVLPAAGAEQEISVPTTNLWKNMSSTSADYSLQQQKYTVYIWQQEDHEFQSHSASEPIVVTMNVSEKAVDRYAIELSAVEENRGEIRASASEAAEGETVSLFAAAAPGFRFVRWEASAGGQELTVDGDSFVMPGCDVLVRAIFEQEPASGAESGGSTSSGEESAPGRSSSGEAPAPGSPSSGGELPLTGNVPGILCILLLTAAAAMAAVWFAGKKLAER